jgi:hypothetical protein
MAGDLRASSLSGTTVLPTCGDVPAAALWRLAERLGDYVLIENSEPKSLE